MRRIHLAVAVMIAFAVAGCSGGNSPAARTATEVAKGVTGEYYYVNIPSSPVGGVVASDIGGITCGASAYTVVNVGTESAPDLQYRFEYYPAGAVTNVTAAGSACGNVGGQTRIPWAQSVLLSAYPGPGKVFIGWAGDCAGAGTCELKPGADRTVIAIFGAPGSGHQTPYPGSIHGPAAAAFAFGSSALKCDICHGTKLQGLANAPACATCHGSHVMPFPASLHGLAGQGFIAGSTGALRCTSCHGPNLEGMGNAAPSCKSCHATLPHIQLGFTTFATGPSVTAACVKCHTDEAKALLSTNHFTWMGSSTSVGHTTPSSIGKRNVINNFCVANASNESRCMQCHPSYSSAPTKSPADGTVAVNTGPMYLWNTNAGVDLSRIDCLVCHGNLATSKYMKSPANFGQPWPNTGLPCTPACSAAQICSDKDSSGAAWSDAKNYCRAPTAAETSGVLNLAANSIGAPQRANCGFCHFNAGGGDNVKMGDLGSALKTPTQAIDVHMGSTASYAPQTCVGCHKSGGHGAIKGSGLSIPIDNEGRLTCTDCHSGLHAPDHSAVGLPAVHLDFIACQTCHIPTFSRTQYTKMDWDWQTTADKQACQGLPGCVGFNAMTYPAGGAQIGTVAGVGGEASKSPVAVSPLSVAAESVQTSYDWKKGIVIWGKGVTPAYRFIAPSTQQQGTHETTVRDGLLGLGTPADPYRLSDPLPPPAPVLAGWKIAPFKKMTGRTPVFADQSAMIVPHVFGPDSLWQNDLRGYPVVPNTLGSPSNVWTQTAANAIWTGVSNYGAAVGGQLGAPVAKASGGQMIREASHLVTVNTLADLPATFPATLYLIGAEAAFPTGVKTVTKTGARQFTYMETIPYTVNTGTAALPALPATSTLFVAFYKEIKATDWAWANTVMFINLNHEVAPKASALGCASCHPLMGGSVAASRMKDLYNLQVGACEDPINCKKR